METSGYDEEEMKNDRDAQNQKEISPPRPYRCRNRVDTSPQSHRRIFQNHLESEKEGYKDIAHVVKPT